MRTLRQSGRPVGRQVRRVFSSAWWLSAISFGLTACSSGARPASFHVDGGPPVASTGSDETGVAAPADAEAGVPADTEAGPGPGVDASGDAADPTRVRMTDVSILFPLPATAADLGLLLAPSAVGSGGVLFPSAIYASQPVAFARTGPLPAAYAPYDDWRVVAMRIDPCFGSLAPDPAGAGCMAQLRLVFQRVTQAGVDDAGFADDSAVHVFYDLSRGEFLALAQSLVALRMANERGDDLGPLAPHPIIVRQGLGGAMSQGVQRLILEYAGRQNLVRIAESTLAVVASSGIWQMSAFDVSSTPKAVVPLAIPSVADADGGGVFVQDLGGNFGTSGPYFLDFFPTTSSVDNLTALGNGNPASLAGSDRQAALDALVRIENPNDNSANTIDCLSCHTATPLESIVASPLFSFDDTGSPLAYQPEGTSVARADMRATPDTGNTNIHVFSYLGARPQISQRVVNESAAVAQYLNDLPR